MDRERRPRWRERAGRMRTRSAKEGHGQIADSTTSGERPGRVGRMGCRRARTSGESSQFTSLPPPARNLAVARERLAQESSLQWTKTGRAGMLAGECSAHGRSGLERGWLRAKTGPVSREREREA